MTANWSSRLEAVRDDPKSLVGAPESLTGDGEFMQKVVGVVVNREAEKWRTEAKEKGLCADFAFFKLGLERVIHKVSEAIGCATDTLRCDQNFILALAASDHFADTNGLQLHWCGPQFFSGSDSVDLGDNPSLQLRETFTVMIWARPTARTLDWARLIGKGESGPRNYGIWIGHGEHARSGELLAQVFGPSSGRDVWSGGRENDLPLNEWAHLAMTFRKDATHELFVNAVSVGSSTTYGEPLISSDPVTVGQAPFHTGFIGDLKDGRIYAPALAAEEIEQFQLQIINVSMVALACASDELRNDKDFVLRLLKHATENDPRPSDAALVGALFIGASDNLRGDRDFIMQLAETSPGVLLGASNELHSDAAFMRRAVKILPGLIYLAPDDVKGDPEFALDVLSQRLDVFNGLSAELTQNRDFVVEALKLQSARNAVRNDLQHIPKNMWGDVEVASVALKNHVYASWGMLPLKDIPPEIVFAALNDIELDLDRFSDYGMIVNTFGDEALDLAQRYRVDKKKRIFIGKALAQQYGCISILKDSVLPWVDMGADMVSAYGFIKEGRFQFMGLVASGMVFNAIIVSLITWEVSSCIERVLNVCTFGFFGFVKESYYCYKNAAKSESLLFMKLSEGFESAVSFGVNGYAILIAGYLADYPELTGFDLYAKWLSVGTSLLTLPLAANDFVKAMTVRYPEEYSTKFAESIRGSRASLLYHFAETAAFFTLLIFQLAFRPYGIFLLFAVYIVGLFVFFTLGRIYELRSDPITTCADLSSTICADFGRLVPISFFGSMLFVFDVAPPIGAVNCMLILWRLCVRAAAAIAVVYKMTHETELRDQMRTLADMPLAFVAAFGTVLQIVMTAQQWQAGRYDEPEPPSDPYETLSIEDSLQEPFNEASTSTLS